MNAKVESLERSFLGIAHVFFMLLTSAALIVAIVAVIWGLAQVNQKASEEIVAPSPTYQQLKETKARQKAETVRREKSPSPSQPQSVQPAIPRDTIPAEFLPVLNDIEASLTRFSQTVNNPIAAHINIRKQIYDRAARLNDVAPMARTLADLKTQSAALAEDADRIVALGTEDLEYVTWQEFLTFFFDSLTQEIQEQKARRAMERDKVNLARVEGMLKFYIGGAAFVVFLVLTLYLVLFTMEKHLRVLRASTVPQAEARIDTTTPVTNEVE